MTSSRFERSLLLGLLSAAVFLASAVLAMSTAEAQSAYGDTCAPVARCVDGESCAPGTHTTTVGGMCFCVPGPDDSMRGAPTFCCGTSNLCPSGTTCRNVDGSDADICAGPDLNLCSSIGTVVTREQAHDCFTPPGATAAQPYWRLGDCDGDGVPNGMEAAMERDPCCNEGSDLGCCLAVPGADPLACCNDTAAESASGCCLIHDGSPELCCDGEDAVTCCAAASDPLTCCEDVATDSLTCCVYEEDPAACCLDADGEPTVCCALDGADDEDACEGIDAGAFEDTGTEDDDAGERPDAGIAAPDSGMNTMDGGTANSDGGTSFGGGGGCVCTAGRRAPSPTALLALALAITIPVFRRRR